jgi:hypothetical protein
MRILAWPPVRLARNYRCYSEARSDKKSAFFLNRVPVEKQVFSVVQDDSSLTVRNFARQ